MPGILIWGTDEQRGRYVLRTAPPASSTSATDVNQYIQPGQSLDKEQLRSCRESNFEETDKTGIETTANLEKRQLARYLD
jgi:hypothetical protein